MAETTEKTRVIGYVRVSTEMQASEGLSLEVQRARLRAYAEAMDLQLVRIEEDAGFSAKNLKRPALKCALTGLDEGQASGLLVVKLDRLTRRVLDLAHLIERYFTDRFSLLSVADSIDTRTAGGRLVLNVMSSAAQWERETISERVRDTFRHLREQGVRLGSPPFGWQWTGERDEHGRLVVRELPEEQETIRRASQLRLQGCTLDEVATALIAEGRKTKNDGHWHSQSIRKILRRAEVPNPTKEQTASRRRDLGIWWSTTRPYRAAATKEAVELAVALREEGFSLEEIAHLLVTEGHRPLNGRVFHRQTISSLLRSVDPSLLGRLGRVRNKHGLGDALSESGGAARDALEPAGALGNGTPTLARVIFLRKQGCSLREIGSRLAEEGYVPKRGGKWQIATLSQMLRKAKVSISCRYPHGIDPFGFERAPSAIEGGVFHGLRPVPGEVDTIKRAVALRVQGSGMKEIAATLNDEERLTKLGSRWTKHTVSKVLHRVLDHEPTRRALAETFRGADARKLLFGWIRDTRPGEDGRRQIRKSPDQQATIRRAVELRQRGCSTPDIARRLNSEGHATQRGRTWNNATVLKILRREGAQPPAPLIAGRDPYGWERASGLDPEADRGLRPVPAEQEAIRRAIELRRRGRSLTEIAATLEREGRPTKYGGRWCSAGLAKILSRVDVAIPVYHPARSVPFGWKRLGKGDGLALIPDPQEWSTLRRIVTLWRQGNGTKAIARILTDEGQATRCGGPWLPGTVHAIVARARAGVLTGRDRPAPQRTARRQATR